MRVFFALIFILFSIINWSCTKVECPPQANASLVKDSSHTVDTTHTKTIVVIDTITLQGTQIIHSEVHSITLTTNYATSGRLAVWSITNGNVPDTAHSYLKFDYSSIPTGATIISATLTLYADTAQVEVGQKGYCVLSGPNNWLIAKLNTAWAANTITWKNAPVADTTNAIQAPGSGNSPFKTYTIDLTSIVQYEFSNPSSNYGVELRLANESKWRGLAFYSPDGPAGLQPTLLITYKK